MSGRKYIGEIIFDQNIDKYSKSKRDSLKREIYKKMVGNEWFIKNIEIRSPGQWSLMTGPKDKNFIKINRERVSVVFYGRSPLTKSKSKSRSKAHLNWATRNFKRSMNFDKKMFLDDSLKAIKVSVTVSPVNNKTKRKTKKKSKKQSGGEYLDILGICPGPKCSGVYRRLYKEKFLQYEKTEGGVNVQILRGDIRYIFELSTGYPLSYPKQINISKDSENVDITLLYKYREWSPTMVLKTFLFEGIDLFHDVSEIYTDLKSKLEELPNLYISLGGFYLDSGGEPLIQQKQLICNDFVANSSVIIYDPAFQGHVGITNYENDIPNHFYFAGEPIKIKKINPDYRVGCECGDDSSSDTTQTYEVTSDFCTSVFGPLKEIIKEQLVGGHRVVIDNCLLNSINSSTKSIEGLNLSKLCYLKHMFQEFQRDGIDLDKFMLLFGSAFYVEPMKLEDYYKVHTSTTDPPLTFKGKTSWSHGTGPAVDFWKSEMDQAKARGEGVREMREAKASD